MMEFKVLLVRKETPVRPAQLVQLERRVLKEKLEQQVLKVCKGIRVSRAQPVLRVHREKQERPD
jgi:hypothetical protein